MENALVTPTSIEMTTLDSDSGMQSTASISDFDTKHLEAIPWSVDDALEYIGTGQFHKQLWLVCGGGFFADGMEKSAMGFLIVVIKDDFNVPDILLGIFGSACGLGLALGALCWGVLSDRCGRRYAFKLSLLATAVFGLISAAASSFEAFVAARVVMSFGIGGTLPVDVTLLIEFLPVHLRNQWGASLYAFYGFGRICTALLAWAFLPKKWRAFVVTLAVPSALLCVVRGTTPESPVYLAKNGEFQRASQILKAVADQNGVKVPQFSLQKTSTEESFRDLLRMPQWKVVNARFWTLWILVAFMTEWSIWVPVSLKTMPCVNKDPLHAKDEIAAWLVLMSGCELAAPLIASASGILECRICSEYSVLALVSIGTGSLVVTYAYLLMFDKSLHIVCLTAVAAAWVGIIPWVFLYILTPKAYSPAVRTTAFGLTMSMNRVGAALSPLVAAALFRTWAYGPAFLSSFCTVPFAFIACMRCSPRVQLADSANQ